MLAVLLAVAAAMAKPNNFDLMKHPLRKCGGHLGIDLLIFANLADFCPVVLLLLLLAAYLCGDRLEGLVSCHFPLLLGILTLLNYK